MTFRWHIIAILVLVSSLFISVGLKNQTYAGNGVSCPKNSFCSGNQLKGASLCELAANPATEEGPDYWCCPQGMGINSSATGCVPIESDDEQLDPTAPVTNETFEELNPLVQFGDPEAVMELRTPGDVISRALRFLFPIAGLILFVILLWSGFEMITGAENPKAQEAGSQRAGAALIGFLLLFVSYWVIRLIEVITGAQIF